MVWKVVKIDSGAMVKAGFADEREARTWLELKMDDSIELDSLEVLEVDEDEELESQDAIEANDLESEQDAVGSLSSLMYANETHYGSEDGEDDEGESLVAGLTEIDDIDY